MKGAFSIKSKKTPYQVSVLFARTPHASTPPPPPLRVLFAAAAASYAQCNHSHTCTCSDHCYAAAHTLYDATLCIRDTRSWRRRKRG